jgi:hypothetical protein
MRTVIASTAIQIREGQIGAGNAAIRCRMQA